MTKTLQERLRVVEGKGDGYGNGPRLRNPDGPEAADALDAAAAREKRLREALGKIAAVRWGLPDTATDGEAAEYWAATCHDYRARARAALRGEGKE